MIVIYNATNNLAAEFNKGPFVISSNYETLTFNGDDNGLQFNLKKLQYSQSYNFTFDLKYWLSYQGKALTNSGVYIFTPDIFQYDSLRYSVFSSATVQTSKVVSQITLTFSDDLGDQYATVKVRLY